MREEHDVVAARAGALEVAAQPADDAVGLRAARRRHFEDVERAGRLVEHDEIGKRSAGIDGNAQAPFHYEPPSSATAFARPIAASWSGVKTPQLPGRRRFL